jgi:hypothetical protein
MNSRARWLIEVYLAKARQWIADILAKHHAISLNVILECDLVPGRRQTATFGSAADPVAHPGYLLVSSSG